MPSKPQINFLFEILYEIGVNALLDGYYRECISSIASSLETYYRYYIQVVYLKHSGPPEENITAFKSISNQSERQLGAYISTYLIMNQTAPELLSNKLIKFRNEVIHKGKIPSINEAKLFAKTTLDLIFKSLSGLIETSNEYMLANDMILERSALSSIEKSQAVFNASQHTIIQSIVQNKRKFDFDDELEKLTTSKALSKQQSIENAGDLFPLMKSAILQKTYDNLEQQETQRLLREGKIESLDDLIKRSKELLLNPS